MVGTLTCSLTLASVLSCGVVSTLRSQEEGTADRSYCTLLDCLCSWGQVGHVLELIDDWLPRERPQAQVRVSCLWSWASAGSELWLST